MVTPMKKSNLPASVDAESMDFVLHELIRLRAMRFEAEQCAKILDVRMKATKHSLTAIEYLRDMEKAAARKEELRRQIVVYAATTKAIARYMAAEIEILEWLGLR